MNNESKTIRRVLDCHLCMGCGTCAAFCPVDAIIFQETSTGYLEPVVDFTRCTACGICLKVCPGHHAANSLNTCICGDELGPIKAVFVGRTTNAEVLELAQSGGVATTLVNYLVETRQVDKALVTVMPKDGTLRPCAKLTSDRQIIMDSRGSKYCPVALNEALKQAKKGESIAVVGLPCQILGLKNAIEEAIEMPVKIKLMIGLICDRQLSFQAIDHLIDQAAIPHDQVCSFEYRSKRFRGWPGDVRIVLKDGTDRFVSSKERVRIKDIFTPIRCRLCFDKFNIFADIVLGDAWGIKDKQGCSSIIARTTRGLEILQEAQQQGLLTLYPISAEKVMEGQRSSQFQKRWEFYTKAWQTLKQKTPDFGKESGLSCANLNCYIKELKWALDLGKQKDIAQIQKAVRKRLLKERMLSLPIIKKIVRIFRYQRRL